MKHLAKVGLSAAIVAGAAAVDGLLIPAAQLAANPAVVGQLANSDRATLLAHYLGHSPIWLEWAIWFGAVIALLVIWLRPSTRR